LVAAATAVEHAGAASARLEVAAVGYALGFDAPHATTVSAATGTAANARMGGRGVSR